MLSDKSFPVIDATLPLVGSRIGEITPKFYPRLFAAHPELLDGLFSRSDQRNGNQQQALAGFMSLREVDLPANASLYLCGPLPFMKNIRNEAMNAGIPATKIHYEVFGPDIWLAS
jgi:nitric oxide dioxygenase